MSTTYFENLSEEYNSRLMKAIIGFEIEVENIDTVFKLSQNRDKESYQNIIEKLSGQDADAKAVSEEMTKRAGALFRPVKS
jgi:transcriptional regulator